MQHLSRRAFLLGTGGAVVLAACGGGDTPPTPSTTTAGAGGNGTLVLGEAFDRNNLLVVGIPQRAPFLLFQIEGGLVPHAEAPPSLEFEAVNADDGTTIGGLTVDVAGADVGRAYYPLVATFPTTGLWTLVAEVGDETLETSVMVNATVTVPQVGDPMPSAPTPTTADALGVDHLCTADPVCPLHDVSLDTALAAGRPVALLVSTPAYCNTAICGPVLDLLVDAAPSGIDTIHVEVYPNEAPPDGRPSPIVPDTFGLGWEPVLFVADATGTITARLDNIYDGTELAAALATV